MSRQVLTCDEIAQFAHRGWLRLSEAFPLRSALAMQDFMWEQLRKHAGVDRHDRTTWRWNNAAQRGTKEHPIYAEVASPRLLGAISDLLDRPPSSPSSWGEFLITPPTVPPGIWRVPSQSWHWDAVPGKRGLFVLTLYSSIGPRQGGTLLVEGSHLVIERFFAELAREGKPMPRGATLKRRFGRVHPWIARLHGHALDSGDRIEEFMSRTTIDEHGVGLRVIESTGEPGDAFLCDSTIYHVWPPRIDAKQPRFMRKAMID